MKKKNWIIMIVFLCLLVAAWLGYEKAFYVETSAVMAPSVSAQGAILTDCEDGRVIYEKDGERKLFPASTTKIMTALVALEIMDAIGADMTSTVTVPQEAVGIEGSSLYLKAGEKVTMEELLYGMMLQSGNDSAVAVAVCTGGTTENFVKLMNIRAKEIGCRDTNFTNPSGLWEKEHFTTASDMAKIAGEAMKNPDFRKIVGASSWSSAESGRSFANKNKTIAQYDGATGIKIGYTKASGRTLVASAKKGDRELIAVVLDAPDWFEDAYSLLDYGFMKEE